MKTMPQEIEVWYLIPALRRELAKIFIANFKMSQRQVSEILGITESAVSQYLNAKRGSELKFSEKEMEDIKKTAETIFANDGNSNEELYRLCVTLRACDSLCDFHRKQDSSISKDCDLCVV